MLLECSTAPFLWPHFPVTFFFQSEKNWVAQVCPKQQFLPSPVPWSWAQSSLVPTSSCTKIPLQCMFYTLCSPAEDIPLFSMYALDHMEFSHPSDPWKITCAHLGWAFLKLNFLFQVGFTKKTNQQTQNNLHSVYFVPKIQLLKVLSPKYCTLLVEGGGAWHNADFSWNKDFGALMLLPSEAVGEGLITEHDRADL